MAIIFMPTSYSLTVVCNGCTTFHVQLPAMKPFLALLILSITAVSLHGQKYKCDEKFPQPIFTSTQKARLDSQLNIAIANFHKDSTNADAIIWLGRRYGYLAQYEKAIEVFTYGIKAHPQDARMYRHRGHRYITIRCFDKAIDK